MKRWLKRRLASAIEAAAVAVEGTLPGAELLENDVTRNALASADPLLWERALLALSLRSLVLAMREPPQT